MSRRWLQMSLLAPLLSIGMVITAPTSTLNAQQAKPARQSMSGEAGSPVQQAPVEAEHEGDENDVYRHSATVRFIGRKLDMSPEKAATTFEFLNFFVLAALVLGFLVRALPKAFRTRSSGIQKQLVEARSITEQASARLSSVEDRLGKLDEQIAGMRQQFETDAAAEEQRMLASVEAEKAKILAAAEAEMQAATGEARRQLQRYAAELAIDQAAQRLVVSAETDRLLVQNFAKRLARASGEGEN